VSHSAERSLTPDRVKTADLLAWVHGIGKSGRTPSSTTIGARIACLSSYFRFDAPGTMAAGRQRSRLQTRLENSRKQHGWGDISDRDYRTERKYRTERDSIQAALTQLPDEDRIRTFDAYRAKLLALPAAIAAASPARREELGRIVVEQVVVNEQNVEAIVWTAQARPFVEKQRDWYRQGALRTHPLSDDLDWHVA
jgi:hypothetical protein